MARPPDAGAASPTPDRSVDPVVLRPSAWFLGSSMLSPAVLVVLGGWGVARAGELNLLPVGLLVLGVVLGVVVLVDLPYRAELGPAGVVRICPLRRQRVDWDDVMALGRTRVDRGPRRLVGRAVAGERSAKRGGLVLEVGPKRRRYLLTDRQERPDQYHELRRQVAQWAPGVPLPGAPG